jgi:hypothetical protein
MPARAAGLGAGTGCPALQSNRIKKHHTGLSKAGETGKITAVQMKDNYMQKNNLGTVAKHKRLAVAVLVANLFLGVGAFAQTQPVAKPAAGEKAAERYDQGQATNKPASAPTSVGSTGTTATKPTSQSAAKTTQKPTQKIEETKKMTPDQTQGSLPLFYQKLELLDKQKHKALAVAKEFNDFSFAAKANVIPVVVTELSFAAKHYPLVFVAEQGAPTPTLVAMVGLGDNKNIFVDAKGKWKTGAYTPAWVRRYPFLTVKADDKRDAIAFDPTSKLFGGKNSLPLFQDSEPTDALKQIVSFQNEFNTAFDQTGVMAAALMAAGILEPASLAIGNPDKDKTGRNITGFLVVNETKLRALDATAIANLHKANAIGLAYAQLLSMANLQTFSNSK